MDRSIGVNRVADIGSSVLIIVSVSLSSRKCGEQVGGALSAVIDKQVSLTATPPFLA